MSMYWRPPVEPTERSVVTHYGNETETHEPCPGCGGPSVWTYTRQEGDRRVDPLVISCPVCDLAAA